MAAPEQPLDLKQVAKLFNDTIATIRDNALSIEALEPEAIAWLKDARCKLMRDIEKKYYELERSRHKPLSQPGWAVDPSKYLYLYTSPLPTVLQPYRSAIGENLHQLLKDCGFQRCSAPDPMFQHYDFRIHFPLTVAPRRRDRPRTLQVEDEFSAIGAGGNRARRGGTFAVSNFGRLLADVREDNGGTNSETRIVTEENRIFSDDEESDDDGKEGANSGADETEAARSSQVAALQRSVATTPSTAATLESDLFLWIPFTVIIFSTLAAILVAVQRRD